MNSIINFENIYVNYNIDEFVLKNINLNIKENENWAILGANGSGKSTLIKLFSNDLYPNTKFPYKKLIFNKDRWNIFELKKYLGIITNDLHYILSTSAKNSTAFEVILSGFYSSINIYSHQNFTQEQHNKVIEILKYLDILHIKDKKVCEMSTGELRRCLIGRALIHNPKAFVLDEPTVGLDIKAQYQFIELMRKLSKKSSIILITHHIEEIFPEITHIALIHNNTIYKQGKKEDILTSENLSKIFNINIEISQENNRYFIKKIF
ncbi:MAG: iron complex transport system ATP-binding protein [Fusobacteriaceae bacterium]|jgi:iron complex transport system ATP-binding protein|nr:transporter related protein [Fusobacteriales bacterium]MDN5303193.1 iron complex transport system ATP-binding protein [Fusobacteriaceae bacterium]